MGFRDILERTDGREADRGPGRNQTVVPIGERGGYGSRQARVGPIEGEIASQHEFFWRREDLKLVRVENDRAFFRVETNLKAQILHMERFGAGEVPARVRNFSAGGAAIGTKCQCCTGDKILLKVKLLAKEEEWKLFCKVVRIEEHGVSGFVYGCQFIELDREEQGRLLESVTRLRWELRG